MSVIPQAEFESELSSYGNDMHMEKSDKHVSGKRIVVETIIVFIVSVIVLYALAYFFMPEYIVKIEGKEGIYVGKTYGGIGLLSVIIAAIYAFLRSRSR